MRALAQRLTTPYALRPGPGRAIGRVTAVFAIGAGLIHVSAAVEHSDLPAMMIGFEAVVVLQVGLGAVLIHGRPSRALLIGGIALMASAVLLWVVSRTAGLGFLVEGTHVEPVGLKDGVTVLFELLAIGGLGLLLEPGAGWARAAARWLASPRLEVTGAVACALFVPALLVGGHQHATTHVAATHGPVAGPHLRSSHSDGHPGPDGQRRHHSERRGTNHDRLRAGAHTAHAAGTAPAHPHGAQPAVAHAHGAVVTTAHDHVLASGVVAGAGHGHAGGGAAGSGGHPAGSTGHGAHPPGHDSGYGGEPEQPQPPPQESPAPGLDEAVDEADELIP